MELVANESSAALLPDEEAVREGILDNRPRTMSAPLESEEFVTFEVKINGERAGRLKSVSIQDGGARFSHAPVIYPRSVISSNKLEVISCSCKHPRPDHQPVQSITIKLIIICPNFATCL